MSIQELVESLDRMVRVGEAAKYLGVSKETLRNWDRAGTLVATRHPVTGYRYYQQEELEAFLQQRIAERKGSTERLAR